jgi:Asp-tRNA(Asn)/Glu-tRNA(Gln) amidotransferase A subunit family amidase
VIAPAFLVTLVSLPAAASRRHYGGRAPVGIQIVAPRFEEPLILRVASSFSSRAAWVGRPQPLLTKGKL